MIESRALSVIGVLLALAFLRLAEMHEGDDFGSSERAVLLLVEEEEGRVRVRHDKTGGCSVHEVFEGEISIMLHVERVEECSGVGLMQALCEGMPKALPVAGGQCCQTEEERW